jgi:membrane-bound ClpP family serine protease
MAACFGNNIATLLALTTNPAAGGLGALLIILGLIAILATAFQIVLMIARGGMLVILTGILPLSACGHHHRNG